MDCQPKKESFSPIFCLLLRHFHAKREEERTVALFLGFLKIILINADFGNYGDPVPKCFKNGDLDSACNGYVRF